MKIKAQKVYDAEYIKSAVLETHEGIMSDTVEIRFNGEKYATAFKNEKKTWLFLYRILTEQKVNVMVERKMWGGETKTFEWKGSPSYECRFGKGVAK